MVTFLTQTTSNLGVTAEMLNGVFDQFIALLPVVIPVSVGFIGIRKALGLVFGTIKKA